LQEVLQLMDALLEF